MQKALLLISVFCIIVPELTAQTTGAGWRLVWADEFNYNGLPDSSKWSYDVGGKGWGNRELQYYTDADTVNAFVHNGELSIKAVKMNKENNSYTSARLITKHKGD